MHVTDEWGLEIEVRVGFKPPLVCDMHIAPMVEPVGGVLIQVYPREIADRLGRAHSAKTAAKSAT